ncbi:DUF4175 family protein [uncultured Algibacter sp.]|uniref:DUF4175 family protein n=1 Tax=uncultured Algibacter sp. TaxID=298659 RepID=UPI00261DA303|nr:DUF4175 family protein [uncultured Algibacter sp.]
MQENFNNVLGKLEQFIRKYYTNELIKGTILFFAIGFLYLLFTLFVEYILWLSSSARTVLFWVFIAVESVLFAKFIALPLLKLFKLQKGIDYVEASKIIGQHFSEVNDKLLNVLQLNQSEKQSELLLASIEQKSTELNPIPFKLAINFSKNIKYLKYAAIPVAILLLTFLSGNSNWFSDSYTRVVNYKTAYEPPAPFRFFVVNNTLNAIENEDFKLIVKTVGNVVPENAEIEYNNETYFLQNTASGEFEFVFSKLKTDVEFRLLANNVISKPYTLSTLQVPSLVSFDMVLDYPNHTRKKDETLKGTGNAIVPEGTNITWLLKTKSTENVKLFSKDTLLFSSEEPNSFSASKRLYNDLDYSLSTSNVNLKDYENLSFKIDVVKDEYPEINIKVQKDSLDLQSLYFYGQLSDDYGLTKLQLVYYPVESNDFKEYKNIPISKSNIADFVTAFPNDLDVAEGVPYEMYFQVFDNDVVNKYKSVKSNVFVYRKRTQEEETQKKLQEQGETIKDLNKSLKKYDEQEKQLEELTRTQKEKSDLNFNDKKKLESFLKRQKQQDEMMKNFNKKLKDNLEDFQKENPEKDVFKEDLKERLKENEEQLERDEKLLEELKKLQEKINKEELVKKLEELAKQNKNKKRSLQQLLELTKRYYVEKKLEKLKEDLMKLAIDQEKLSNDSEENNTRDKQDELNKKFDKFTQELDNLKQDNKGLKKPLDIPQDELEELEIEKEQQNASEELGKKDEEQVSDEEKTKPKDEQNQNLKNAQKSQKKAAQKMMNMSQKMQSSMQGGGGEQMQEDMEMLRQILDNLVLFSFDEEALMNKFRSIGVNNNKYANYLRNQNNLREHFEHIDDSLFALSLRQPKLSERVNKEITEVYFNIEKALDLLAENQLYQGVSNQQFAITAANNLADILSNILDNMQESLSMSPGKGQGDMQLPDIIMSQEELNKMMEEGLKNGKKGDPKEGEGEKEGKGEKDGDKGKNGKEGKEGENTGEGDNGNSNGEGLNGALYEIYQKQQQLRQALKDALDKREKNGIGGEGDKLLKKMEDVELDLLNKGFTNQTLQKMMELQHQLLKLENATFQQGDDNKRESETNTNQFKNNSNNQIPTAKQYFKTTEILNKQALPLQQIYKKKVQEYFKTTND